MLLLYLLIPRLLVAATNNTKAEVEEDEEVDAIEFLNDEVEKLPMASALVGEFPHHFEANSSLSDFDFDGQDLAEARHFGGAVSRADRLSDKALAAEQGQAQAAARAALVAAYRLAEEAQNAAEDVEAVAAAKQVRHPTSSPLCSTTRRTSPALHKVRRAAPSPRPPSQRRWVGGEGASPR